MTTNTSISTLHTASTHLIKKVQPTRLPRAKQKRIRQMPLIRNLSGINLMYQKAPKNE